MYIRGSPAAGDGFFQHASASWPGTSTFTSVHLGLAITILGLMPATLLAAGQGAQVRLLYPMLVMALALGLFLRRPAHYLGFTLWVFMLTPLIRRMVDAQAGFESVSTVMLAPYLAALPSALALPGYAMRPDNRFFLPFVLVLAAITCGFLVAVLNGRVVSGAFDALRWALPPLVAVFVIAHADRLQEFERVIVRTALWAVPLLSLYGIVQFVEPQLWDRLWMRNVMMNSIGEPEPYRVRVFSTLNSPGSLAIFLMAGLMVLQSRRGPLMWLGSALGLVAMLLTLSRAVWTGWLIALAWFLIRARASQVLRTLLAGVAVVLGAALLLQVPQIAEPIETRVESFTSLAHDNSANARLQQYGAFVLRLDEIGLGEGLANTGVYRMKAGEGSARFIDSGIIDICESLGLLFGPLYLAGVGLALTAALKGSDRHHSGFGRIAGAIALGGFAQLPMGSVHVGEHGLIVWLFLGLALAGRLQGEGARARGPYPA